MIFLKKLIYVVEYWYLLLILLFLLSSFIISYFLSKYYIKKFNLITYPKKKNINILSYNLNRLPYTYKPLNFNNYDYDIICLQEYFQDIFKTRNRCLEQSGYNYITTPSKFNFLADSGLVVLSKYPIEFIDFVPFKDRCSIDCLAEKGFLVVKIRKIFLINTHLQSCYNCNKKHINIQKKQVKQIEDYISLDFFSDKNVLICGDFNNNIFQITNFEGFKKIYHKSPTIWDNNKGIFSHTSVFKKTSNQVPKWLDGAFIKSDRYQVRNISLKREDDFTDHLGISFLLKKN